MMRTTLGRKMITDRAHQDTAPAIVRGVIIMGNARLKMKMEMMKNENRLVSDYL